MEYQYITESLNKDNEIIKTPYSRVFDSLEQSKIWYKTKGEKIEQYFKRKLILTDNPIKDPLIKKLDKIGYNIKDVT